MIELDKNEDEVYIIEYLVKGTWKEHTRFRRDDYYEGSVSLSQSAARKAALREWRKLENATVGYSTMRIRNVCSIRSSGVS